MQKSISVDSVASDLEFVQNQAGDEPRIPDYLREVYWWAYLHPMAVKIFEHQWIVNLILWGNFARLRDSALNTMGDSISGRTLQVACVYGDFTPKLAERLTSDARLDVVDIAPIQLRNLRRKMQGSSNVFPDCQNAADLTFAEHAFDQAVLFFLLHELPEDVRLGAIREALRVVRPGGKLVFVDYHRPVWQHPHRYIMKPILSLLEPFALDLWEKDIVDLIPDEVSPVNVEKTTYFGGLYQKVVITL